MVTRVADMSVDDLKTLIQETITQTLTELLRDPDEGLELREDFVMALRHSLETAQAGGETFSADSVAAKLGLSW
jgi:predicted RecB family endonuclease